MHRRSHRRRSHRSRSHRHRSHRRSYRGGSRIVDLDNLVNRISNIAMAQEKLNYYNSLLNEAKLEQENIYAVTTSKSLKRRNIAQKITYYKKIIGKLLEKYPTLDNSNNLDDFSVHSPVGSIASDFTFSPKSAHHSPMEDFSVHSPVSSIASDFSFSSAHKHKRAKHAKHDDSPLNMDLFDIEG